MEIQQIKSMLGSTIYQRAWRYFKSDRISGFSIDDGFIRAEVLGSNDNIYEVEIDIDEDYFFCDCPCYDNCKHIGAVLLYHRSLYGDSGTGMVAPGALITRESLNEAGQQIEAIPDTVYPLVPHEGRSSLLEELGILRGPVSSGRKKYRLIFLIDEGYISGDFSIKAALQYVRMNGEPGRIENFNRKKLTEPLTDPEKYLLHRTQYYDYYSERFTTYLPFIAENHSQVLLFRKNKQVELAEIKKITIAFTLSAVEGEGIYFAPLLHLSGADFEEKLLPPDIEKMQGDGFSVYLLSPGGKLLYSNNHPEFSLIKGLLKRKKDRFTQADIEELKEFCNGHLSEDISVHFDCNAVRLMHIQPRCILEIDDADNDVHIHVLFSYSGREVSGRESGNILFLKNSDNGGEILFAARNAEYENLIISYLLDVFQGEEISRVMNSYRHPHEKPNIFRMKMALNVLLAKYGARLINDNIEIRMSGTKEKLENGNGRLKTFIESGIDWFELDVNYISDDGSRGIVTFDADLLSSGIIRVGKRYVLVTPEDIATLEKLHALGFPEKGKMRFSKMELDLIHALYKEKIGDGRDEFGALNALYEKLRDFKKIKNYPLPRNLSGTLRSYQRAGYNWLNFLNEFDIHGCLADDMGLGKTIQTLALLQYLKEKKKLSTSLVIVPRTIISNWINEIERFTKKITYVKYIGPKRKKDVTYLSGFDLIITSYQTLQRDIETFSEFSFYYLILDESHYIKNSSSLSFKAVKTLQARHRLSLTGTPVENNTMELWSQVDFINPGLLGGKKSFFRHFARPIEKYQSKEAVERLRKLTAPFILRRKKEEVAKELPDKEEIIHFLEMGNDQKKIYSRYKKYYRAVVSGALDTGRSGNVLMEILKGLLKLRQVSLFPELVDHQYRGADSCKFDAFREMLDEILMEDHKVLVFSQFVQVLDILKEYLETSGRPFAYIDGSTRNREKQIKLFQEDENVRIFLLSIKAGGVGINLTGADYVILFDPWWNPAVEAQAIDRTHRIGQTRKVIAYKYIVRDTVEEKILRLQEKKKKLFQELITEDAGFFKSLSRDDIVDLFS